MEPVDSRNGRTNPRSAIGVVAISFAVVAAMASPALAVGTDRARITSDVHDSIHVDISNSVVPAGAEVHLRLALAGSRGKPLPTGTVDFSRYGNTTCAGTPLATENDVVLVAGVAESTPYVTSGEVFSLRASYDGDAVYGTGSGPCEVMNAGVVTIAMAIHDVDHNDVTGSTLAVGSAVHASAIVTSTGASQPTGTVEFKFWSASSSCPGHANSTEKRVVLVSGQAESRPYTLLVAGSISHILVYRGDANHKMTTGPCAFVNAQ